MKKLILRHDLSPGDILVMTAAIRDLHKTFPDQYLTDVRTPCPALFEANPYITPIDDNDPEAIKITMEYPLIHESNEGMHHFIFAFHEYLEQQLKVKIKSTKFGGDIYISDTEKGWYSQIHEIAHKDVPYWIINSGCKQDYTNKLWDLEKFQQVVTALPRIYFVQIGSPEHIHKTLEGSNVINLIGKTDLRELVRLVYHSAGIITGVSLPMHLAAAVPVKDCYNRKNRPCIVLAGGREPSVWEAYTNHAYLHTCGMLPCCDNGGCWKSRIIKLNDGDSKDNDLCQNPVLKKSGQTVPRCLDMISAKDVVYKIKCYLEMYNYYKGWKLDKSGVVRKW